MLKNKGYNENVPYTTDIRYLLLTRQVIKVIINHRSEGFL